MLRTKEHSPTHVFLCLFFCLLLYRESKCFQKAVLAPRIKMEYNQRRSEGQFTTNCQFISQTVSEVNSFFWYSSMKWKQSLMCLIFASGWFLARFWISAALSLISRVQMWTELCRTRGRMAQYCKNNHRHSAVCCVLWCYQDWTTPQGCFNMKWCELSVLEKSKPLGLEAVCADHLWHLAAVKWWDPELIWTLK